MLFIRREFRLRLIAPIRSVYFWAALALARWHYRQAGWPVESAHRLAAMIAQVEGSKILTWHGWRAESKRLQRWCNVPSEEGK